MGVAVVFYDKFKKLCDKKGVTPSRACLEMGLSRSVAAKWKSTKTNPSAEVIPIIAKYFGVTTDYLLVNGEDAENAPADDGERDDELSKYLDMLRTRPECRMLFSLAQGATKEDVERTVAIIEALRGQKEGR